MVGLLEAPKEDLVRGVLEPRFGTKYHVHHGVAGVAVEFIPTDILSRGYMLHSKNMTIVVLGSGILSPFFGAFGDICSSWMFMPRRHQQKHSRDLKRLW